MPNLITLARLCAVPAAIWLMLQHRLDLAFVVFIGAGISDALDGWIARAWNARSQLGAVLDPIADKALLVSVYVTLASIGVLPDWLAILVVFRDLLIVGGVLVLWAVGLPPRIKPIFISKANTAAQILLAALVLLLAGFGFGAPLLLDSMILACSGDNLCVRCRLCGAGCAAHRRLDSMTEQRAPIRPVIAPPAAPRTATRGQRWALFLGFGIALLFCLWMFQGILTPFVLAGTIAYFLDPLATRLARLGIPRGIGAFLLVTLLGAVALIALLLLYPLILAQLGVLVQRLPVYIAGIGQALRDLLTRLEEALGPDMLDQRLRELAISQAASMLSWLGTAATRLIGGGFALFSVFTFVVVTPVVAFYLLRDWPAMLTRIESWLPRRSASVIRQIARDTDRVLSAWLRGQLLCCLGLGIFYAFALHFAGLELGITIGIMSGFLTFIPYVGSLTGFATAVLLAIGQFGSWQEVLVIVVIFIIGQGIEGYIIYPYLLGNRVELHAVWVIFALFAGGVAFGFLGVLLAVPMAAAIGVVTRYWLRRYLESPLYLDPPRTGQ